MKSIRPGATLGILGGGQLGRMFTLEAKRLGFRVMTLEPAQDSPCGQVADHQIIAEYADQKALQQMAESCEVITYEFENINAEAVEYLESLGKPVFPSSHVLRTSQNRLREKDFLRSIQVPVTDYAAVNSLVDLEHALKTIGCPAILKTADGGYDGKGQKVVETPAQAEEAFKALQGGALIWEKKVPFAKELSILCARGQQDDIVCYPLGENHHVRSILDITSVPASVESGTLDSAKLIAKQIAEGLGFIGLFCVELFCLADGTLRLRGTVAPAAMP